jgi:hypothetical protein
MLWNVDKQAWLFPAVITDFNLILDFTVILGAASWMDFSLSFIVNSLILIYVMPPGVKQSFDPGLGMRNPITSKGKEIWQH